MRTDDVSVFATTKENLNFHSWTFIEFVYANIKKIIIIFRGILSQHYDVHQN
jgi:hypothetical protein